MFFRFCSNPGHPFAAGMTLAKLAAVTVDDNGKETFVTGGSLDRIQKVRKITTLLLPTIMSFFLMAVNKQEGGSFKAGCYFFVLSFLNCCCCDFPYFAVRGAESALILL